MEEKIYKNYFAVIPADVRYDENLCSSAKLLYGEITALCNEKGFCWASNEYFADLYKVTTKTISNWIADLRKQGYITETVKRKTIEENGKIKVKSDRKIMIVTERKFQEIMEKNFQYNNTNNNNILMEKNFPSEELNDSFNKIWETYPKKENKQSAFKEYCLIFNKLKKDGYEDNSINRAIWYAVGKYRKIVDEEGRETKYIKSAKNFFKTILEEYEDTFKEHLLTLEEFERQQELKKQLENEEEEQ